MSIVFWKNEKVTSGRENLGTLGAITSLKHLELKADNFQSIPETVMISGLLETDSISFRKPSDNVPEYSKVAEEDRPFTSAVISATDFDRLGEINEAFKKNKDVAEALAQNFRKFKFSVKNDLKGVKTFMEVIEHARNEASKNKKLKSPALLLKGCQFAMIPLWNIRSESFAGVEIVLKSIERLEVIEEVTLNTETETATKHVEDVSSLFD